MWLTAATAPETKLVPFTVRVNPLLPGLAIAGTSGWLMNGVGFDFADNIPVARNTKTETKCTRLILPPNDLGVRRTGDRPDLLSNCPRELKPQAFSHWGRLPFKMQEVAVSA